MKPEMNRTLRISTRIESFTSDKRKPVPPRRITRERSLKEESQSNRFVSLSDSITMDDWECSWVTTLTSGEVVCHLEQGQVHGYDYESNGASKDHNQYWFDD